MSSSYDQSIVARSVRWRSGRSRAPPVSRGSRCLEPLQHLSRRERLHAHRRELEREREVVEATADRRDSRIGLEPRVDGPCPGQEEADRLLVRERRHRVLLLPRQAERLPARHEQDEVRAGGEHLGDPGCGLHDLLEVVEQQEQPPVPHLQREVPAPSSAWRRYEHEPGVAHSRKRDPVHAVLEVVVAERGRLARQA